MARRDEIDGLPSHNDLIKELLDIMRKAGVGEIQRKMVMERLVPLIVRRDHTIYNFAYNFARDQVRKETSVQSK
jgi:hypothetical protein